MSHIRYTRTAIEELIFALPSEQWQMRLVPGDEHQGSPVKPGSLPLVADVKNIAGGFSSVEKVREGQRIDKLFAELRAIGNDCETIDEVAFKAAGINEATFDPPLNDAEVMAQVKGVWKLVQEGRCFAPGYRGAVISLDEGKALYEHPVDLALWHFLRSHHTRDHEFAVCPKGLSKVLSSSVNTIRKSRDRLLANDYLEQTYRGGRGPRDPSRFKLGSPR